MPLHCSLNDNPPFGFPIEQRVLCNMIQCYTTWVCKYNKDTHQLVQIISMLQRRPRLCNASECSIDAMMPGCIGHKDFGSNNGSLHNVLVPQTGFT